MLTKCRGVTKGKSLNSAWDIGKVFPEEVTFYLVLERDVVSSQRRDRRSWHKSKNLKASKADQAEVFRVLQQVQCDYRAEFMV